MTCSLQTYRSRIGTFHPRHKYKTCINRAPAGTFQTTATYVLILIIFSYCGLVANVHSMQQTGQGSVNYPASSILTPSNISNLVYPGHFSHVWDPYQLPVGVVAQRRSI
jgi:hypothetical protein